MASLIDETGRRRIINIRVAGFEISEDHTTYLIEVQIDSVKWQVKRRFKEFHYLHETLCRDRATEMKSVAKFPPKKSIGHLTVKFVQDRQKRLSAYLQSLVTVFDRPPQPFTNFLHWERYEIQGITGSLTEYLFEKGDLWLERGYPFEFSILQLYAINQRMRLPAPTCGEVLCSNPKAQYFFNKRNYEFDFDIAAELGSSFKSDFGHLLDFISQLESVKLTGSDRRYGRSNLVPDSLHYDLSPFKRLLRLQLVQVNPDRLVGAEHLRARLLTLSVRASVHSIRQLLLPEWPPHRQLGPDAPVYSACTSADFSDNGLSEIDAGVKLMPRLKRLRLKGNSIARLDNLDELEHLAELDLSKNSITKLDSVHLLVGNLKELELANNRLTGLEGLSRLYGLVTLGLRANLISDLSEVAHLANLPLLARLILADNPLTQLADYRVRALQLFDSRASELVLDDEPATAKELDTIAVLQAIRRSRELSLSSSSAAVVASSCSPPAVLPPAALQPPFRCQGVLLACPQHPLPPLSQGCHAKVDISIEKQVLI
uniref:PX domain-containing protein n=1 Tax=Macrostomum lignano TaxID=282301 RepID=A0A1I8GPU4_9PLAT